MIGREVNASSVSVNNESTVYDESLVRNDEREGERFADASAT